MQLQNAPFPIILTPSGIVTEVRLVQFPNARSRIVSTTGIMVEVGLLQLLDESLPIYLTPPGSVTAVRLRPSPKA